MKTFHEYCETYPAVCQALATLGGALFGALIVWITASMQIRAVLDSTEQAAEETREAAAYTKMTAQINLMRDLVEFYESNDEFKKVHKAITECEYKFPLSREDTENRGFLDWKEVNSFIALMETLGFYWKQEVLDLDFIDHQFGALIREAYLHADMRAFIHKLRTVGKEKEAGTDFQALAEKLIDMPKHAEHVKLWKGYSCKNN